METSSLGIHCAACREPVVFPCYRVRVELAVVNAEAARRLIGTAEILGSASNPVALKLAAAMTGGEALVKFAGDESREMLHTGYVCVACGCADTIVARLIEGAETSDTESVFGA